MDRRAHGCWVQHRNQVGPVARKAHYLEETWGPTLMAQVRIFIALIKRRKKTNQKQDARIDSLSFVFALSVDGCWFRCLCVYVFVRMYKISVLLGLRNSRGKLFLKEFPTPE